LHRLPPESVVSQKGCRKNARAEKKHGSGADRDVLPALRDATFGDRDA
jgi:hypothetical protein